MIIGRGWCWFWIGWCLFWMPVDVAKEDWLSLAIMTCLGAYWTTRLKQLPK